MSKKTPKVEKLYEFIKGFIAEYGYPPSYREMVEGIGVSSTGSIYAYLDDLKKMNLITWERNKARTLRIVERSSEKVGEDGDG